MEINYTRFFEFPQWSLSDSLMYLLNDLSVTKEVANRMTKPKIKRVLFNPPATIIFWEDGTKSVVKCQKGDQYDPEKGFVMAYLKKLLGNKNEFNKEINKWVWEK